MNRWRIVALASIAVLTLVVATIAFAAIFQGRTPAQADVAPTATPTVISNPGSGPRVDAQGLCNDDVWAEQQLGLHVQGISVPWRTCQWVWNAYNQATVTKTCPNGWLCTLALDDNTVKVFVGDGNQYTFRAGTFNYVPRSVGAATQSPPCAFLQEEDGFGMGRVNAYHTLAGNFSCSGAQPSATPVPGSTPTSSVDASFFVKDAGQVGRVSCSKPDSNSQNVVCKSNAGNVTVTIPTTGSVDYWDGFSDPSGGSCTVSKANGAKTVRCTSSGTVSIDQWTYKP